jgi:hypothetical protein
MTVSRRELARSSRANSKTEVIYRIEASRMSPFDAQPIRSLGQHGPGEARELAGHGGDHGLRSFAAAEQATITLVQSMLRHPRLAHRGRGGAALADAQRVAERRPMAIVPRRFDEHAAEMRIARFGDAALVPAGAAGMFRRDQAGEAHEVPGPRKPARVADFRGDCQRGQIVHAAKTAKADDALPQGLKGEQVAQIGLDRTQARDGFLDGAPIGLKRVLERRDWPPLGLQPREVAFRPGLRLRPPAAVPQQEFREAVPGAQQIGPNVLAAPQQVARRLFVFGGDMDGGQRPRAIQNGELCGISTIRFDPHTGAPRNEGRGNHVARHVARLKKSLQLEAARARFVAAPHAPTAADAIDKSTDRSEIRR